jgi:hypothetical protein
MVTELKKTTKLVITITNLDIILNEGLLLAPFFYIKNGKLSYSQLVPLVVLSFGLYFLGGMLCIFTCCFNICYQVLSWLVTCTFFLFIVVLSNAGW